MMGDEMEQESAAAPARLKVTGLTKSYGGVRALRQADLAVRPGTVHGLVGENGAGKSTLIKIVSGAERADAGQVQFDGQTVAISSTSAAMALGIQTVYQEPQLFPELTVAENIFLGREPVRGGMVDWKAVADAVGGLLETVGLNAKVATMPIRELTVAQQQQVSIAKALATKAKLLILDEPSAILTASEIDVLFAIIRRLTAQGVAVIYITHRLDELFDIADEVTMMRDGQTVATAPIGELSVREIAERIVGGVAFATRAPQADAATAPEVLRLSGLSLANRFDDIDLVVRAGEIVGVYGLVGSGADALNATVYGITPPDSGAIAYRGQTVSIPNPGRAKRLGISLLPANRASEGSFSFQSIAFNITIGSLSFLGRLPGLLSKKTETDTARDLIRRLAIKTPSETAAISAMSGGNAQKVILARQLVRRPTLMLLSEPTQGVDIGAKEEIHRIVDQLAADGVAVLVTTSDLGEVLRMSDRIVVIREGRIVGEFPAGASQVDILALATGGGAEPPGGAAAPPSAGGSAS
ncbi:MAG: sugar ABC transporter ATP-binding protein [Propionibacteriaceae bacterium]|jgi:rhamnose transport system ATP-binding protein|nr:sugar ABC transporter ATP-binding protein [Propionibacteriaceae bacterium]